MPLENNYAAIIAQIKTEIETARLKAATSVNRHLLILYWKIGNIILQQQNLEGWGTKVIERLSDDLRKGFPDMRGTSARNLKYMRAFAEAYPVFVQQTAAQIPNNSIVQQPAAQLPWFHICTLLDKVKSPEERQFYTRKAAENNWSRNVLTHQIESGLYHRQGKAVSNFVQTLPSLQSDLAKEMLKDPYKFDFLNL